MRRRKVRLYKSSPRETQQAASLQEQKSIKTGLSLPAIAEGEGGSPSNLNDRLAVQVTVRIIAFGLQLFQDRIRAVLHCIFHLGPENLDDKQ